MDSGLSPKEQVELMLKRARTIEQMKEEVVEDIPEVLVKEEEPPQLPSLYEPVTSLSLVEDVEETKDSIIARFSIDPDDYSNVKLNKVYIN